MGIYMSLGIYFPDNVLSSEGARAYEVVTL